MGMQISTSTSKTICHYLKLGVYTAFTYSTPLYTPGKHVHMCIRVHALKYS